MSERLSSRPFVLGQRRPDSRLFSGAVAAAVVVLLALMLTAAAHAASRKPTRPAIKPTVVLVHGAFADASSWNGVVSRLQDAGYPVIAPANALRGPASDAAYLRSVLETVKGPVVLVGHSYGGEVITNAALGASNVRALVYVAAFAPAEGESQGAIAARFPGALLGPDTLLIRPFPQADGTPGADAYIKPSSFRQVFAQDLPPRTAATMAATQRPEAISAIQEPSGKPAWASLPSWYLVARDDHAIAPAAERFMAQRAGSHTVEIRSSHAVPVSHPGRVAALILTAARATAAR